MTPDTAAVVRTHYGFTDVTIGERLEGGYANDVFRVLADGEPFVLRVQPPPVDEADVAWEHRLTCALAAELDAVFAPVATRDGSTAVRLGERCAWLVPFADGDPADPAREPHRRAAAAALGRVHAAGAALATGPRPRPRPLRALDWPLPAAPPELRGSGGAIAAARGRRSRRWRRSPAGRRRRPSSTGDLFPGNVLVAEDRVTAVIDWEEAQPDWLVWDLAIAVGELCAAGDDIDRGAARCFAAAYRDAGGPSPPDDDALILPLVAVKRTLEVLRSPTDRHPRWDLARRNLRSLELLARP